MLVVEVLTMLPLPHATHLQVKVFQTACERQAHQDRLANEAGIPWSLRDRLAIALYLLNAAYEANPERFVNGPPKPPALPSAAWNNKPDGVH